MELLVALGVSGVTALIFIGFMLSVTSRLGAIEAVLRNIDKNLIEAATDAKKRAQP